MGAVEVLATLLVAAVAAAAAATVLWLRQVKAAQSTASDDPFCADKLYRLHSISALTDSSVGRYYGLAEADDGHIFAYLTPCDLAALRPGDCVTSLRGQLVKVDGASLPSTRELVVPLPPPPGTLAATSTPQPVGDDDATVIAGQEVTAPAAVQSTAQPGATAPIPSPATAAAPTDADRTRMVSGPVEALLTSAADSGIPYLRVIDGPDLGRDFPVPFVHSTIGRDDKMTISLGDDAASRLHCEIIYRDHAFWIRDAGSTNGTWCNDRQIAEYELIFGDRIKVAETEMVFTCDGYELRDSNPAGAVAAFENCVAHGPDFVQALKILAFMLERDIARRGDAGPIWRRIAELES